MHSRRYRSSFAWPRNNKTVYSLTLQFRFCQCRNTNDVTLTLRRNVAVTACLLRVATKIENLRCLVF